MTSRPARCPFNLSILGEDRRHLPTLEKCDFLFIIDDTNGGTTHGGFSRRQRMVAWFL
jgi:hypothetical protein